MCFTDAFSNHGNSPNGTKNSLPPTYSQKPCREMLLTSAWVMSAPALFDFVMTFCDGAEDSRDFPLRNPVILLQFDAWFKPDLQLAFWSFYVYVHAIFL